MDGETIYIRYASGHACPFYAHHLCNLALYSICLPNIQKWKWCYPKCRFLVSNLTPFKNSYYFCFCFLSIISADSNAFGRINFLFIYALSDMCKLQKFTSFNSIRYLNFISAIKYGKFDCISLFYSWVFTVKMWLANSHMPSIRSKWFSNLNEINITCFKTHA